jgi:hypothetical protein
MKQLIFTTFLMIAVTFSKAQNLSAGPIAGINHSWLTNSGTNKIYNPGVNLGGTITYSFNPHWGMGADLLFCMEGVRNRTISSGVTTTRDAALNFVRIQPKGYYFFGNRGDAFRPKLFAGLSAGILAGGSIQNTLSASNESADVTTKRPSKDLYHGFDAGIIIGGGINWRIGKGMWFTTDLAYNNGLVNLSKAGGNSQLSRSLALNLGLTFPIGNINPK